MSPKAPVQVYSFSAGLLDPTSMGRLDLKSYYSGARTATNLAPQPLGGMSRRAGWSMVAEIPDAGSGVRLAPFEYNQDAAYLHVLTDGKARVFHDDALTATLTGTPWTAARLPDIDFAQQLATMVVVHPDVKPKRILRQGSDTSWGIDDVPLTGIPTNKFDGTTAEAVWSDARGWPVSVLFHQGRTYFGGSRSLPDSVWGSNSGEYWAFDERMVSSSDQTPLDDTAVSAVLGGGGGSAVRRMLATDDLFIFSDGGAWTVKSSSEAIKPDTFLPLMQSEVWSANVRPVVVEGSVVYMSSSDDGAHSSIYELTWDDQAQSYYARDLALRCPSIMRTPVGMDVRLSSDGHSASTLVVVNSDGSLAVLTPNRFENITAWTLWETEGEVLDVAVLVNTVYVVIKRTIAGVVRYFLEKLDAAASLDCSTRQTSATAKSTWAGLGYLEGHPVTVSCDDATQIVRTTVSGGVVTVPYPASSIEVGLDYGWTLEPMPPEVQLADGTLVGRKYRINRVSVRVDQTRELKINGKHQPFMRFGASRFNVAQPPYSGIVTRALLGWTRGGSVILSGVEPRAATILSITLEIAQ